MTASHAGPVLATRWPCALGPPLASGEIRSTPDDFAVSEVLGFEPDGSGEHLWIEVEKREMTTGDAQVALARAYRLHPREVSFAGLKDKHAVTSQWFSLRTGPARAADDIPDLPASLRVLRACRNSRKLRRGSHGGNRFVLTVRNLRGDVDDIARRLARIRSDGVPNYFGPQRFGRHGDNVESLLAWHRTGREPGRSIRGILLSAGRAFLFNEVLATRLAQGNWNRRLAGDRMNLDGTGRHFPVDAATEAELDARLACHDIHPTGPLWGAGDSGVRLEAAALEAAIVSSHGEIAEALAQAGLEHDRRPLRVVVKNLEHDLAGDVLRVSFTLAAGAYATAVLRELVATATDGSTGMEGD